MPRSRLKPLNDHLRDENEERRARIQGKGPGSSPVGMPPAVPAPTPEARSHAELIADFTRRHVPEPSWRRHVPDGRFCVRFRYFSDRWVQLRRSATFEDRAQFIASLAGGAEILAVFEDAA